MAAVATLQKPESGGLTGQVQERREGGQPEGRREGSRCCIWGQAEVQG